MSTSTERVRKWLSKPENREKVRQRDRLRHERDGEARRAYARAWYAANKERKKTAERARRLANPDRCRDYEWKRILRGHGLTPDAYMQRLREQGGGCSICTRRPSKRLLHVDHDHVTGKVRSLLCSNCNTALGLIGDDPKRGRQLAAYLEHHRKDV